MLELKKITKNNRIELMKNGFYKVGYMSAKEFNERLMQDEYFHQYIDRILFILENMIEHGHEPSNIVNIRSKHMEDSDSCRYDFDGKSYLVDGILFHVYADTDTVSVIKIK